MQLELFPFERLSPDELGEIFGAIRRDYWHLRNLRGGRFGQAAARRCYRQIAAPKKTPAACRRL
ncbi:MAG: hypothetical protein WA924_16990 [Burkholderiaceae bacterium]